MKRRKILIIVIGLAVLLSACGRNRGQDKAAVSAGPTADPAGSGSKSADPAADRGENAKQERAADPAGSGQDRTAETGREETPLPEEAGTAETFSEEAKPTGRQDQTSVPSATGSSCLPADIRL